MPNDKVIAERNRLLSKSKLTYRDENRLDELTYLLVERGIISYEDYYG